VHAKPIQFLPDQVLSYRDRREYAVFKALLKMVPGLEGRLVDASEEGVIHIADLVRLSRSP
jgi:hypothetical protein